MGWLNQWASPLKHIYDSKKQSIQCRPLWEPFGFYIICCICIIHQSGCVLYGARPFGVSLWRTFLQQIIVQTLWLDAVCGCLAHTTFLLSRFRFRCAGCYMGSHILCRNKSFPASEISNGTDAIACCMPAHIGC